MNNKSRYTGDYMPPYTMRLLKYVNITAEECEHIRGLISDINVLQEDWGPLEFNCNFDISMLRSHIETIGQQWGESEGTGKVRRSELEAAAVHILSICSTYTAQGKITEANAPHLNNLRAAQQLITNILH